MKTTQMAVPQTVQQSPGHTGLVYGNMEPQGYHVPAQQFSSRVQVRTAVSLFRVSCIVFDSLVLNSLTLSLSLSRSKSRCTPQCPCSSLRSTPTPSQPPLPPPTSTTGVGLSRTCITRESWPGSSLSSLERGHSSFSSNSRQGGGACTCHNSRARSALCVYVLRGSSFTYVHAHNIIPPLHHPFTHLPLHDISSLPLHDISSLPQDVLNKDHMLAVYLQALEQNRAQQHPSYLPPASLPSPYPPSQPQTGYGGRVSLGYHAANQYVAPSATQYVMKPY